MSTKSKARAARRHPTSVEESAPISLRSLPRAEREAAGELAAAVLDLATLGVLHEELR